MPPEFRFRLNGEIVPEIFIQRALVNSEPTGEWQVAVGIDAIGRFTIDAFAAAYETDTGNNSCGNLRRVVVVHPERVSRYQGKHGRSDRHKGVRL